jgi:restriction system protein
MARRTSFISLMNQIARDQAKRQREQEQYVRAQQKAHERAQRENARQKALLDKEAKQQYLNSRIEEIEYDNKQIVEKIKELDGILEHTFQVNDAIAFDDLRIKDKFREFSIPSELQKIPPTPNLDDFINEVKKPTGFEKLIPGTEGRYQKELQEARKKSILYEAKYEKYMAAREVKINALREAYEKEKQGFELKVQARNQEVDELSSAYHRCDPDAVCTYNTMVLERSEYPVDFPQEFRLAYLPEPKELVVEYELPNPDIVPPIDEYRYVKTKDIIEEKLRKAPEIKEIYQGVIASICLRTIHEVFEADQANTILIVVFNGFVQTIDPSTGKDIRPCLISIRTTKQNFSEINLSRVDKRACLRNLGAQVSQQPDEMQAIKPVIEFDMVDKRFVEESDILADLESRPNLMDLNPFEFENLVSNLFGQMGFQSKLTRSSRDGGVDAVAFDPRPILGGKVVIQAKRYKNVVGVSAVRDLYGTMINEGAGKGILVATSHYGPDAYDFAKDKPMELIDGSGLLYLLEQQGIKARIIFPDETR